MSLKGKQVTDEWYLENKFYDYSGKFDPSIGHFTQMIWKGTKKIGLGFSLDDEGNFYVVANYFPAGNYKNKFNENVLPVQTRDPAYLSKPKKDEPKAKNHFLKTMMSEVLKTNKKNDQRSDVPLDESLDGSSTDLANAYGFDDVQIRFINEALAAHNDCREVHGVDSLLHNPDLSKIAQAYANKLAGMNRMVHSQCTYKNEKIGENLAYAYDSRLDYYSG